MNPRILITAALLVTASLSSHAQTSADVIVYGSTPGGYCAAIAAAREGASVILLEPTSHVGGMNTGGLSFSDSNQMYRDKLMGLFHEWHLRIQQDYQSRGVTLPYNVNVKDQTNWSYEPHVATRVTNAMLTEAGVVVLTGRYLQSVLKTGPRITGIVTGNGTYTGRVFIDGSYEGDLMAAAGVSWTIGREGRADFNESLAGKVYPKPVMNINGRDGGGNPLPLITTTDAGPVDDGDDNLMTYSFRLAITTNSANKIPYPAPANYDPARFEVMRRYIQAGGAVNMVGYDQYSVPNNKADGNNSIAKQFSLGFIGAAKNWHTANQAGRAAIFEAHKQYTLEFLHFLANDSVFTPAQRSAAAQWGLCADEFATNGNFPPQLYVRESRRMQGQYVISENDIITNPSKPDPIMVSSFPIDSHDCQRVVQPDGKVVNEGTIYPVKPPGNNRGYPYHVPYRSILPQSAQCDNLLVPVALSCTHVAISSLRIEATWMLIGQSAGIAAAMAADRDVAVQALPYTDLKPRLLAQGQVLTLPAEFTPKPNVLMIAVDDLNDWVGALGGHPQTVTPNIDRLAGRGMLFTNAHCQGTLCNPSRISVLWGRRPSSSGFYDNNYPITNEPGFLNTHVSLPAHFAASGYKTMTAGKVFHPGTPAQSQLYGPDPGYWRNGFDQPIHQDPQWHQIWDFGPQTYAETEFVDHQIATWLVARLGETHNSPFFLSAGFYRPHVPFFPPSRVHNEFTNVQLPPVKLDDWNDIPAAAALLTLSNPKIPTHDWMLQNNRWNEAVHAYLACIKWTDEQIGRLLDALDAGPNANNTIIVLFSDHGYHLGEKQRWEKFSLWERTTRVPLIISVPDGLVGETGKPVELLSIYPTLVELCGLPANPVLEGVSLTPLLDNPAAAWNHVAISTLEQNNHAIRDERWRYIRYANGSEELYDHQNDPNEWHNLAAGTPTPEQAAAITSLRTRLPTTNVVQRGDEQPENVILNGGFETGNLTSWTQAGSGTTVGNTTPLAGTYSALQVPGTSSQLFQTFTAFTTAVTTSFVFSATDPGNDGTRSMNVTWRGSGYTSGSPQINLRLTDVGNDNDGDIQVFDGSAWQTVIANAVVFDSTPSTPATTLTLTINSFGAGANYDITVGSNTVTGLTHFHGGVLNNLAQLAFVNASNTSGTSLKIDDVSVIEVSANDFNAYISDPAFGIALADRDFGDDPDGDKLANGLEAWFGTHPGQFNAGLAGLTKSGNTITFTHPHNGDAPGDVSGYYQWSPNLADWYAGDGVAGPPAGPTVSITSTSSAATTTVTAAISAQIGRVFLRAGAVQN